MATTIRSSDKLDAIYFKLKKEQPEELEKQLKELEISFLLKSVKGRVKPNKITMSEIVKEVNSVRKKRYEEKNRI